MDHSRSRAPLVLTLLLITVSVIGTEAATQLPIPETTSKRHPSGSATDTNSARDPISGPGYAGPGPCTASPAHFDSLTIPRDTPHPYHSQPSWSGAGTGIRSMLGRNEANPMEGGGAHHAGGVELKLKVTLPSCEDMDGGGRQAPFPVVFFFNGFACSASFYGAYAARLASWGYAVVQYDTPLGFPPVDVATELTFLEPLLSWLEARGTEPGGFAEGLLDLDVLAVVGHSRGGKMATLHYAGTSSVATRIRAAYLIDPVDNSTFNPTSPSSPSAYDALRASQKAVGISGASLIGVCNPKGSNYELLYEAASEGSWLEIVEKAGHCDFLSAGIAIKATCSVACFPGAAFNRDAVGLTLGPLVAWLNSHLQPGDALNDQERLLQQFYVWVQAQQSADRISFEIKK